MVDLQILQRCAWQAKEWDTPAETSHEADRRAAYARAHKTATYSRQPTRDWLAPVALATGAIALPLLAVLSIQA